MAPAIQAGQQPIGGARLIFRLEALRGHGQARRGKAEQHQNPGDGHGEQPEASRAEQARQHHMGCQRDGGIGDPGEHTQASRASGACLDAVGQQRAFQRSKAGTHTATRCRGKHQRHGDNPGGETCIRTMHHALA